MGPSGIPLILNKCICFIGKIMKLGMMKQNNKMYGCAKNLFISLSQKEGISLKALKFHKTYLTP